MKDEEHTLTKVVVKEEEDTMVADTNHMKILQKEMTNKLKTKHQLQHPHEGHRHLAVVKRRKK